MKSHGNRLWKSFEICTISLVCVCSLLKVTIMWVPSTGYLNDFTKKDYIVHTTTPICAIRLPSWVGRLYTHAKSQWVKTKPQKHITLFLHPYRSPCKHTIHVFGYCDKQHSRLVWNVDNLAWGDLIAPMSGEILGAELVKILAFPSQPVICSDLSISL